MVRLVFLFCVICVITKCKGNINTLKLEQVLVFSRHNIRTPLTANFEDFTPNSWPKFSDPIAKLTQKGVLMETYMAQYFSEWLASENFIIGCPEPGEIHVYSNTLSRTMDTAKVFADTAFRSCNISIHHYENLDVFDPTFHSIFHNNSEYFVNEAMKDMELILNKTDLTESYLELNRILDLQNSEICKQKSLCDLSRYKTQIVYEEGEEPNVKGPLLFATSIVDNFLMSYYEGFPIENVAWGKITTENQWELLTRIIKQNHKVRFGSFAARDIGKPLLQYMFNIFKSGLPKFTVLFGHDSNFCIILNTLNFKEFIMKNQYEPYPIGGKLVFQKWSQGAKSFLKIEYVYSSFSQLRNGEKLSVAQPPQKIGLELKDCKIDDRGLCPWEDFMKLFF